MKPHLRFWPLFALLGGLGLAGNALPVPLFFGVDFLSGNIFVFLALTLLGARAGVGVALLAGSYTYVLWGNPYAWIGMVTQAGVTGRAIWRGRPAGLPRNMPAWVAFYWLLLGGPLILGLYHYGLGLDWQGALMVAFKQGVNDVFNALVAALALNYLPLRRWCGLGAVGRTISLRGLQTNLLAAFAFFPALVVIALFSHAEVDSAEEALKTRLRARSEAMSRDLLARASERLTIAQSLARQVERFPDPRSVELHGEVRFFASTALAVAAVRMVGADGQVVSSSDTPPGVRGADLSDLEWFQRLRQERKPMLALIPPDRMLAEPLVVFAAPVPHDEKEALRGGVVLTYKIDSVAAMFSDGQLGDGMRATLLGRDGRVILGSDPRDVPGLTFAEQRGGAVVERFAGGYRWRPDGVKSKMQGWSASYYVRHVPLGELGWSLVVEQPLKPSFASLQQKILRGLMAVFFLALAAFMAGGWLGRRTVSPLKDLELATTRLAQDISNGSEVHLRHQGLHEIDALVDNFRGMARQLKHSYDELMAVRHDLEQRVAERTADLIRQTEALERSRDEAQRASRAKTEFLSSMSHEMRTPMNAILGFSQYLQTENLSEEHKMGVDEIYKAGMHLLALIDDVLNLAKIEAGRLELSLEPVALAPLVEECLALVNGLATKRGITLVQADLAGAAVRADRVRLKQVLLNLLSNAIKYNREGGSVTISAQVQDAQRLRIRVTDTGLGVPRERLGELFQPFNRLGAENSAVEGSGIGLTITRRLVELMGGEVDVESQVGVGSTFWIELPLEAVMTPGAAPTDHDQGEASPVVRHTVLYIEDNPINLKLVQHILGRRKNIRMLSAHTPELGIELARGQRPDLILLDINLPGLDGYQVLQILWADENLKGLPVVAVTANALPRDIERGMAAGFTEYLTKPLDIPRLNKVVDALLGAAPPVAHAAAPIALATPAPATHNWESF